MSSTKKCNDCELTKPLTEFHYHFIKRRNNSYPRSTCKVCRNSSAKVYRDNNKEAVAESKKKCYDNNREHYNAKQAEINRSKPFYRSWHAKLDWALRKGSNTDISLCGLSTEELKAHLEVDGKTVTTHTIDHIIPYKAFRDWGDIENDTFYQAAYCNWKNIQLLTQYENTSKGASCTKEEFDAYVEAFRLANDL